MLSFLLTLANEEERELVRGLYNNHHDAMLRVAYSKLKGRPNARYEAEEAVQNAFVKIIRYLDSVDFGRGANQVRSYLLTISAHEAVRLTEKENLFSDMLSEEEEPVSEEDFLDSLCLQEDYARAVSAISSLDDRYSMPLELKYVWEKSAEEIGNLLEIPISTVYTLLRRGKKLLTEKLQKERGRP